MSQHKRTQVFSDNFQVAVVTPSHHPHQRRVYKLTTIYFQHSFTVLYTHLLDAEITALKLKCLLNFFYMLTSHRLQTVIAR